MFNSDNRETNSNGNLLIENKMKMAFRQTNKKKKHNNITENKSEKDQIEQSQIVLPSNVLKGKNHASSKKQSPFFRNTSGRLLLNQFHSQISNKSEKYCDDAAEKNSSNKKLGNVDKIGKDSKKYFIGKFCGPFSNKVDQQHSVKSVHHGEICTRGHKETKNNGIISGESKLNLTFTETS